MSDYLTSNESLDTSIDNKYVNEEVYRKVLESEFQDLRYENNQKALKEIIPDNIVFLGTSFMFAFIAGLIGSIVTLVVSIAANQSFVTKLSTYAMIGSFIMIMVSSGFTNNFKVLGPRRLFKKLILNARAKSNLKKRLQKYDELKYTILESKYYPRIVSDSLCYKISKVQSEIEDKILQTKISIDDVHKVVKSGLLDDNEQAEREVLALWENLDKQLTILNEYDENLSGAKDKIRNEFNNLIDLQDSYRAYKKLQKAYETYISNETYIKDIGDRVIELVRSAYIAIEKAPIKELSHLETAAVLEVYTGKEENGEN